MNELLLVLGRCVYPPRIFRCRMPPSKRAGAWAQEAFIIALYSLVYLSLHKDLLLQCSPTIPRYLLEGSVL